MPILYIVIAIVVILFLWAMSVYNGLVTLRNRTKEAWSDITVQLKRRYNLIPNLVKTVKGYAKHEKTVFTDVTKARVAALNAKGAGEKAAAENMLTDALKSIFAVAENYPALRASENFKALQDELTDTENKISASRRFYNSNVRDFNTKMEVFPNNLIASWLKFSKFDLFQVKGAAREKIKKVPQVDL
jgi:LemA protein